MSTAAEAEHGANRQVDAAIAAQDDQALTQREQPDHRAVLRHRK